MLRLLQAVALGAGLIAAAGTAQAQHTHTRHVVNADGATAELVIENGEATLIVNGEQRQMPDLDGEWTAFVIEDENGEVLCTLLRPEPGSSDLHMHMSGAPAAPAAPRIAVGLGPDAAPSRLALATLPEYAQPPRVMIGVRLSNDVPREIVRLGYEPSKATAITFVVEGSPAQRAGLRAGDVIVGIGGEQAGGTETISRTLRLLDPGDTIDVVVVRDEQIEQLIVKVAAFDESAIDRRRAGELEVGELELRLEGIDREIEEFRARMSMSQRELQNVDDPRELADRIRDLSERIAVLNRERAELGAQRALLDRRRVIVQEEDRRFPGGVPGVGGRGERFFFEGDENLPFAITGEFLEDDHEHAIHDLIEMLSEGELEEELGGMIRLHLREMLGGEGEEFELDVEHLHDIDEMEGEFWTVIEEQEARMSGLEFRLDRIEALLERLVGDR